MSHYAFKAEQISCVGCINAITRAIHAIDADATVNIDLQTKQVDVESALPASKLAAAIEEAGYEVGSAE